MNKFINHDALKPENMTEFYIMTHQLPDGFENWSKDAKESYFEAMHRISEKMELDEMQSKLDKLERELEAAKSESKSGLGIALGCGIGTAIWSAIR
jgi:tetrahydromethanopterin S-methyltransferase subunit G